MEENGFSTIVTNVDYTQIAPIQQKRTLAFINHFVATTVTFLNKFAENCETRLERFNDQLRKAEAALSILEAKLSSIEGLDGVTVPVADEKIEVISPDASASVQEASPPTEQLPAEDAQSPPSDESRRPKASQDSRYSRFFRLVRVGASLQAVKRTMQEEGLDPSILDNPDAEVPDSIPITQEPKEDSDSEPGTTHSFNSSFSD
ncbi:WASH complex subunit 3 isoform X2 [Bacillus rossius redtenbacheri]|uniref:WASH complex subunit 3 isoform X2 n=1 Tax=Bacillus rossius redtenbacheri TaxID=93214 RepID=UPI002FDE210B